MAPRTDAAAVPTCAQVVLVLAVTLAAGCGATRGRTATGQPDLGKPVESDLVAEEAWDLRVKVDPTVTTLRVTDDELVVETLRRGRLDSGVFALSIYRAPALAERGSRDLARAGAEDWRRQRHARTFPEEAITFLGLPGHAIVVQAPHAYGLELFAVSGVCVYNLVVLRAAEASESMTRYAEVLLAGMSTMGGGPADAPRCE